MRGHFEIIVFEILKVDGTLDKSTNHHVCIFKCFNYHFYHSTLPGRPTNMDYSRAKALLCLQ